MLGAFVGLGFVIRRGNRDGSIYRIKNSEVLDVHKLAESPGQVWLSGEKRP